MKVTIDVVAKHAGVSKATVSRIINGNYMQTTKETKEKVLRVIQELNYQPNLLAKGLKAARTNVLGIILSNLKNPFWSGVLEGFEDTCRKSGFSLMICNSNEDSELEAELFQGLRHRRVDGIVVNPTSGNGPLFWEVVNEKFPLVIMNRKIDGLKADCVVVNNRQGASLVVEHLLRIGKKRLAAFVYPPEGISTWQERIAGFEQALLDNGFSRGDYLIRVIEQTEGAAKTAVQEALREFGPDGIFSTNNMMTLEMMEGIKAAGLSIPRDVSLIGYDETVWSRHLEPALTTVSQPAYEMGVTAAQKLIKRMMSGSKGRASTTVLEPKLIVRHSCGAKPGH